MTKTDILFNLENTLELLQVFYLEQLIVLKENIVLMDQQLKLIVQQEHILQVLEWEKFKIVDHAQQVLHVQLQE
jgi:hypothetical protein